MSDSEALAEKLAALFHQTSEDHHVAYKTLKSDLIYLLVTVDKELQTYAPGARWEEYYADFFIERYRG